MAVGRLLSLACRRGTHCIVRLSAMTTATLLLVVVVGLSSDVPSPLPYHEPALLSHRSFYTNDSRPRLWTELSAHRGTRDSLAQNAPTGPRDTAQNASTRDLGPQLYNAPTHLRNTVQIASSRDSAPHLYNTPGSFRDAVQNASTRDFVPLLHNAPTGLRDTAENASTRDLAPQRYNAPTSLRDTAQNASTRDLVPQHYNAPTSLRDTAQNASSRDLTHQLHNTPTGFRDTALNASAAHRAGDTGPSVTGWPQQLDSDIVRSVHLDHNRPSIPLNHGPCSGAVTGPQPVWSSNASTQRALLTNGPRFMCLDPHCQAYQCLPYAPPAGPPPRPRLAVKQGTMQSPTSGMDYVSRPMTAGTVNVSRPITVCDSGMTSGHSRPMIFTDTDSPYGVGKCGAGEATKWKSDHGSYRYRRSVRTETTYFVPSNERSFHRVPDSDVPHAIDTVGTHPSRRVQRTHPSETVEAHAAGCWNKRDTARRNLHQLPHSSESCNMASVQAGRTMDPVSAAGVLNEQDAVCNRPWRGRHMNSFSNQSMPVSTTGCVDNSPNPVDGGGMAVKVEEEEIDILAKATEGLFSPDDGENFMTEDETEISVLLENRQTQESLMEHTSDVAVDNGNQWRVFASENGLGNSYVDDLSVYYEPTADGSYVEHVQQSSREFYVPGSYVNVEQQAGNTVLHSRQDDVRDDVSLKAMIENDNTQQTQLDDGSDGSRSVLTGTVTGCSEIHVKGYDAAGMTCLTDSRMNEDTAGDMKTTTDADETADSLSGIGSVMAADNSSYKITFAESELYDMVDRIEKMDSNSERVRLGKRPVSSLQSSPVAASSHKLSRYAIKHSTSADQGIVYHVPDTDCDVEPGSVQNGSRDSDCHQYSTTVSGLNTDLLQSNSCYADASAEDNVSSLNSLGEQENTCTESRIEKDDKFNTTQCIAIDSVVTTTKPTFPVPTTTTRSLCPVTTTNTSVRSTHATCLESTTTHMVCPMTTTMQSLYSMTTTNIPVTLTQPTYLMTTTTQSVCLVTSTNTSVRPIQTTCLVATTNTPVTPTHPMCPMTATSQSVYPVTTSTMSATSTLPTSIVTTTTQLPSSVTTTSTSVTPTKPKCFVSTTTQSPGPVTTTTKSVCPVTTTNTSVTSIEPLCTVTTTAQSPSPVPTHNMSATPTQPTCTVTATTQSSTPVTTTTQSPNPVTTTNTSGTPTLPTCPVTTTTQSPSLVTTTNTSVSCSEPMCTVKTITQSPSPVTTTDMPVTPTLPTCPVTTTNTSGTPTLPTCPVTTTTQSPSPVTTTDMPVTSTLPTCPVTTTTQSPGPVTTTNTSVTPSEPLCTVTTTTHSSTPLTTTDTPVTPMLPTCPATTTNTSGTPTLSTCTVTTTALSPSPLTGTDMPVTPMLPTCPVTTTTQSPDPVTTTNMSATSNQSVCCVTYVDASNVPMMPMCTVVVNNTQMTQLEDSTLNSPTCSGKGQNLSRHSQNRQDSGASRNCFDFLIGLTSQHREYS